MNFESIGLHIPEVLLPKPSVDMLLWPVVACDQYTSQPEYWDRVRSLVGDRPSTLNLVLPEVYLGSSQEPDMIEGICSAMREYLERQVLVPQRPGCILVDRKTSRLPSRKGLIVALDLECYDYRPGANSLIRATEGTIVERLPPRIDVRKRAVLELPHILVLVDDPEKTVIEPLFSEQTECVYDTDLMLNAGHVRGRLIDDERLIRQVAERLERLAEPDAFAARYGAAGRVPLLYAMGDGNHSLATAKAIWDEMKQHGNDPQHPARYALVELVNLHDEGIVFEAIHRAVFNVDADEMLEALRSYCAERGWSFEWAACETPQAACDAADGTAAGTHGMAYISEQGSGLVSIGNSDYTLAVATLQAFLDACLEIRPDSSIDYIHGRDVVIDLGQKPGSAGFYLTPISKHDLFKTIIFDGALPRKTFSMGEADEKRFYLESRRIVP